MTTGILSALLAAYLLGSIASVGLFYRHLRLRYPEVWRELGAPALFDGTREVSAIGRFVWLGGHRRLGDRRLDRLAAWIRILGTLAGLTLAFGLTYVPLARLALSLEPAIADRLFLSSLLATALAALVMTSRLVRRLRESHGEEWRRLGSPAGPWLGGPLTHLRFIGFLWSMRFLSLADRRVMAAGSVLLGLSIAFLASLALLRP